MYKWAIFLRWYIPCGDQIWLEHGPFISDYPNKTSIHRGFSGKPCLMTPEGNIAVLGLWSTGWGIRWLSEMPNLFKTSNQWEVQQK